MSNVSTKWSLRDAMRLSHPKGVDRAVGNFILRGEVAEDAPAILHGFKQAQAATSANEVVKVLRTHKNLPWETIPTQFLKDAEVWKSLFYNGALNGQALLRNVTRMARIGAFDDMVFAADYAKRLSDPGMIARTRLHPMAYMTALVVYTEGQIDRARSAFMHTVRNKTWEVNSKVKAGLEAGMYEAFKHAQPANKRTLVGIDVSGSMSSPCSGLELTCAQVAGALAMTILRTEPYSIVNGFASEFRSLGITEDMSLTEVFRKQRANTFGRTDCAVPMLWAAQKKVKVDHFIVLTDNDTYAGNIKPHQALKQYQDKMGIPARLSVVGLDSNGFTIAEPGNPFMLDVVGGDANLPKVLAEFGAGRL